jgi:predicted dehydrogenase
MTVLGEFKSYDSLLAISHRTVDIVDPAAKNKVISEGVRNTVPDQIMIHGTVAPSNAIVAFQWRAARPFPGAPSTEWRVLGDKGELRLTSSSWSLNVGNPEVKLELFDTSTGVLESIISDKDQWDSLPNPARNIARLYEAYRLKEWYPDFEWAVKRHETIDQLWQRFDASN